MFILMVVVSMFVTMLQVFTDVSEGQVWDAEVRRGESGPALG